MKNKKIRNLIAVVLIIIFTFSVVPKVFQNDTFYVIELGKSIANNGVDWQDHYSIHGNLEYRYPHWAFDVINHLIHNVLGFTGVYVFTGLLASIFILLLFWNMLRKDINFNLAFISSLIIAYMMKDSFFARGQALSYSIFLLEYMILENFVERPTFFKSLALFGLSVIMANCHATAWIMMLILVLPFIGEQVLYAFGLEGISKRQIKNYKKKIAKLEKQGASEEEILKIQQKLINQEEFDLKYAKEEEKREHKIIVKPRPNIKYIWVAIIVMIIGALITPIGLTPFTYVLKISAGNSMDYINEHMPIMPANSLPFLAYTIIIVAMLGFTKSKLKLYDALLILGLYIMTLSGTRSVFLLVGLTGIIVVKMIDDFIKANIKKENPKVAKIFFIVICIVGVLVSIYMFFDQRNDKYVSEKRYPVKAAEFIKEHLDYKNIRMYNRYDYGSYLLMEGIPVFLDSRCDLYTPEFNKNVYVLDDFMDVLYGEKSIFELLEQYDLNYALVPIDGLENTYMKENENCTKLYQDENFVLYRYFKEQ